MSAIEGLPAVSDAVYRYDDPADPAEVTIFPADPDDVTTEWITADVDHAVGLDEVQ